MRVAILGTRGIPASYGGFETFAEELATRLVARGHDVTVYSRAHYVDRQLNLYRGVRLVVLPTIRHKYFDTVAHTFLSSAHAVVRRFDAAIVCNAANAVFCAGLRAGGAGVVLNVDGMERKRRKWNALGRGWYRLSERFATWFPHAVVTDARVIEEYYRRRYGVDTTFIPYGCNVSREAGRGTLDRFGLQPDGYILYVSRLEPENNALAVIQGFELARLDQQLVVVGDAPYAREYIADLRRAAGPRVVFTGAVYGEGYRELQSHALAYVHATEVGGTHPALVEAMGFGNCVLVNDVPENREAAGDAALYFRASQPDTLAALLTRVTTEPALVGAGRERALTRARSHYSWETVTDQYESLCAAVAARAGRSARDL
jgi:glycosyltransferase involved in cell wall biosynthesis